MKNMLLLFLFVLSFFFSQVQAQNVQNSQVAMVSLVQRVDSLEHELSYLKLIYELETLNSDITIFYNEVYTKAIEVKLYLYNKNFDRKLGESYHQTYDSYLDKMQAFSKLIEMKKKLFMLELVTYPYTERESNTLVSNYNIIDKAFAVLQNSMDLLKLTIDTYEEFM